MPNSICFLRSESTRATLSWCSISWACLFWVMHQKQNALPTQTADNISHPIIPSVGDEHALPLSCSLFPFDKFFFLKVLTSVLTWLHEGRCHDTLFLVVHKTSTTLKWLNVWYHSRNSSYPFESEEMKPEWFRAEETGRLGAAERVWRLLTRWKHFSWT